MTLHAFCYLDGSDDQEASLDNATLLGVTSRLTSLLETAETSKDPIAMITNCLKADYGSGYAGVASGTQYKPVWDPERQLWRLVCCEFSEAKISVSKDVVFLRYEKGTPANEA